MLHQYLDAYVSDKLHNAKGSRRSASDAVRTVRTLVAQSTSVSAQALQLSGPTPQAEAAPPVETRVMPERLTIGSGFVGAI
jgi:hypothetical protein